MKIFFFPPCGHSVTAPFNQIIPTQLFYLAFDNAIGSAGVPAIVKPKDHDLVFANEVKFVIKKRVIRKIRPVSALLRNLGSRVIIIFLPASEDFRITFSVAMKVVVIPVTTVSGFAAPLILSTAFSFTDAATFSSDAQLLPQR